MQYLIESWRILLAVGALFCLIPMVRSRRPWVKKVRIPLAIILTIASFSFIAMTGRGLEETLVCQAFSNAPGCQKPDGTFYMSPWKFFKLPNPSDGSPQCVLTSGPKNKDGSENIQVKATPGKPLVLSLWRQEWNWVKNSSVNVIMDIGLGNEPIAYTGIAGGHVIQTQIATQNTAEFLLDLGDTYWVQFALPNNAEATWLLQDDNPKPAIKRFVECVQTLPQPPEFTSPAVPAPKSLTEVGKASFDCNRAHTPTEKAICDSRDLSQMDGKLGSAYRDRLASVDPMRREALRTEQRAWIVRRDSICGADKGCLGKELSDRLRQLQN